MRATLLLLLAPLVQAAIPPTFFGIDQNNLHSPWPPTTAAGTPSRAAALRLWDDGVKWTNLETCNPMGEAGFSPSDPANPCYTWTQLDNWVRTTAPAGGMDVLYTLGGTPGFATSQVAPKTACETAGPYSCLPPLDVDKTPGSGLGDGTDATWINFLTALVTRYQGQIQFYELWNEPDSSNFWAGTDAQFIRMMNDAAATIRAIDPAARILSPSFHGPTAATWFTTFLGNGGAADFDIVNFHGRGQGAENNAVAEVILTTYAQAETVIKAHNLASLPFWDDEAGWLENQVTDPDLQAAYVARLYILHASLAFGRFYWYQWDSPAPYGLQGTLAGTAYAQVASWLVGASISACTASGTVYTCTVTPANGQAELIVWDTSQTCSNGACTTSAYNAGQYTQSSDVAGNTQAVANGSVAVGAKPILLSGGSGTPPPSSAVTISAVTNAASGVSGPVAPGEIVVLYGAGMGPAQLVQAALGADGRFASQLAGTTVSFNGIAAPVLYTVAAQVAAIVPFATSGSTVQLTVSYQGQSSAPLGLGVAAAAPGIFTAKNTGEGQAAALNTDGSANSPGNPAAIGSTIVLFVTGAGQTMPAGTDGAPAMMPYPMPLQPVKVAIGGQMATVQYAGDAPGEVAGLLQINAQIPSSVAPGAAVQVAVAVGNARSQTGATIAVTQ